MILNLNVYLRFKLAQKTSKLLFSGYLIMTWPLEVPCHNLY